MRSVFVSIIAASVIAMIALPGCYTPKKKPVSAPTPASPAETLTVDSSCNFADDIINVNVGDLVRICNDNSCLVTIVFENGELFGRDSVRLSPGGFVNLHVRKGAFGKTYVADLNCASCGTGGGHGSPEFKVGGGGP